MYNLKLKGNSIASTVDTTSESRRLPQMRDEGCHVGEDPQLMIVARQDIDAGIELLYDYGDRSNNNHKTKKCNVLKI